MPFGTDPIMKLVEIASLELRLSRCENLPILSQVANHVLKRADDPTVTASELESIIRVDAGITAKILKVASSALYSYHGQMTLSRAIHMLGLGTVKRMVMTVSFQQMLSDEMNEGPAFDKVEYWRHCFATAVGCRELARSRCPQLADELFGAGMMHDVGYIVLERFAFPVCQTAFRVAAAQEIPVRDVERRILNWDHTDAGAALARRWRMSSVVEKAIQYHHEPALDQECYETTCIVSIANTLARMAGFTNGAPLPSEDYDGNAFLQIQPTEADSSLIQDKMREEVGLAEKVFGITEEVRATA